MRAGAGAGVVDGVPCLRVFTPPNALAPSYFIRIDFLAGRLARIRDYRYVGYLAQDAAFEELP